MSTVEKIQKDLLREQEKKKRKLDGDDDVEAKQTGELSSAVKAGIAAGNINLPSGISSIFYELLIIILKIYKGGNVSDDKETVSWDTYKHNILIFCMCLS